MPLIDLRDIVAFPSNGENSTDTIINGVHFNATALEYWNYTLYSNNTLSNNSKCYLIFDQYRPFMFNNGSFVNATSCYFPVLPIKTRGTLGIIFGALFALSIMFTLVNLNKHGKLHIREDRRFRVIGRRWQWYWMLFTAACGTISCLTSVDVDRDYLQDIALVLQGFFYHLMVPTTLAIVWEATRHWGSWQQRQIVDAEPFSLRHDDRRSTVEFWLPLIFYLFAWTNFFMTIPRSWTPIEKQHDPQQQAAIAEPSSTDGRFKAGSLAAVLAVVTIYASLHHSLKHYQAGRGSWLNFIKQTPSKLFMAILVLGVKTAYGVLSAWDFNYSVLKWDCNPAWPYGLGYGPTMVIIVIFNFFGFVEKNEDLQIVAQRRERGRIQDADLGLTKKPHWWSLGRTELHLTPEQRLRALTADFDNGPTARMRAEQTNIELGDFTELRDRSKSRLPGDPFRDNVASSSGTPVSSMLDVSARPPPARTDSDRGSVMTGTTLSVSGQPQKIRSMLDV